MLRNLDNYTPSDSYSDYDDSFLNDSMGNMSTFDYDYPSAEKATETVISDSELTKLCAEHYFSNYISNVIGDKPTFFLLQAELLLNLRRHKEALSACLAFEALAAPVLVTKCIKMICFYQLNYTRNFRLVKEEILTSNLDSLSESLKKSVIGTIQVSTWIPEFMNCLNNMKKKKS